MSISQHVLVVTVQHPSQHLTVYLVFLVYLGIVLVYSKQLDHVETRLGLVQGASESVQPFVVVFCGKGGEIPVEDLYDKFGDVSGFPFLFFRLFNEQRKYAVERFDELSGVEHNFSSVFFVVRR